jgi:hypothetical protein
VKAKPVADVDDAVVIDAFVRRLLVNHVEAVQKVLVRHLILPA